MYVCGICTAKRRVHFQWGPYVLCKSSFNTENVLCAVVGYITLWLGVRTSLNNENHPLFIFTSFTRLKKKQPQRVHPLDLCFNLDITFCRHASSNYCMVLSDVTLKPFETSLTWWHIHDAKVGIGTSYSIVVRGCQPGGHYQDYIMSHPVRLFDK